jgi:NAD(P)-dependent dehydrogenase (short-subunit alcohol dehydrogenase family)
VKTVLITGVGKGFGKELLIKLRGKYAVIGVTRSQSDIDSLILEIDNNQENVDLLLGDVTDHRFLMDVLKPLLITKGSLWGLVNNAGVRFRKDFLDVSEKDIIEVLSVNLIAPIVLTQLCLPLMLSSGGGRIINVSSIISQSALSQLSVYASSKGGVDAFTRSIASEFGEQNITCNSILPGFCKTSYFPKFKENTELYQMTVDRIPVKRWGTSTEINEICDLLLGDGGSYINGASIPVDGGWLA